MEESPNSHICFCFQQNIFFFLGGGVVFFLKGKGVFPTFQENNLNDRRTSSYISLKSRAQSVLRLPISSNRQTNIVLLLLQIIITVLNTNQRRIIWRYIYMQWNEFNFANIMYIFSLHFFAEIIITLLQNFLIWFFLFKCLKRMLKIAATGKICCLRNFLFVWWIS